MLWIALQPQLEGVALAGVSAAHSQLATGTVLSGREAEGELSDAYLTDPQTALGWWALQFTPKVALLQGAVLLEVSASTRLWGGRAALLRHIYTSNKPAAPVWYGQGDTSLIALARLLRQPYSPAQSPEPSPKQPSIAPDDLPLAALAAAQPHLGTLARLGCTRWGQLRALPRAGVARRFGAALVDALDQAYGTRPDVYPWLTLPEVFEATLELPSNVESAPALLFGARRLLAQLQVWLQLRQLGVLAIELGWVMDARRNTAKEGALVLRTSEASADITHLQRLLAERLGQTTLPAPVQSLRLRTLETQPLQGTSASLLPDDQPQGDSLAHLLERLSARLGPDKVLCLQTQADHRPEQMQVWCSATLSGPGGRSGSGALALSWQRQSNASDLIAYSPSKERARGQKYPKDSIQKNTLPSPWSNALYPTWLLPKPLKLAVYQQQPHYLGPLTLLAGPQRLEAGWWAAPASVSASPEGTATASQTVDSAAGSGDALPSAGGPATLRDYFVARTDSALLLWIYRERLGSIDSAQPSAAWFLHGVFA